jgi:hypothetical protein
LDRLQGGRLPAVCIICGRKSEDRLVRKLTWRPKSVSILLWLTTCLCPPLVLLAILMSFWDSQFITAELPVCHRHRTYWAWRGFWVFGPLWLVAGVALSLALLILNRILPYADLRLLFLGTGLALISWAIFVAIIRQSSLRLTKVTDDSVELARVAEAFVRACHSGQAMLATPSESRWPIYDPYPRRAHSDHQH